MLGVWKERNDRIFRDRELSSNQVFHKIKKMVAENVRLINIHQDSKLDWDAKVLLNWSMTKMKDVYIKINPRILARWDCPLQDWHKINFDGAFKGNPRISRCGVFIKK